MNKLSVDLCGVKLDNPIIGSSGTFYYGKEYAELYDINILGTFSCKGTTVEPRFGNETPRIAECPSAMIAAIGLQNPGINHVVEYELKEIKEYFQKPVMVNIAGFDIPEYVYMAEKLDSVDNVGWIEVNISCPNVTGGLSYAASTEGAESVVSAVRKVTKKPIVIKLSPNVTDIVSIAKACEAAGADGLTCSNTLKGMRINLNTRKPVIANKIGGISGAAVFPIALRIVWQVSHAVKIPVIGVGGVSSAENALEMMMAGATAVGVGAANLVNPYACRDVINGLPAAMEKYGIKALSELKN